MEYLDIYVHDWVIDGVNVGQYFMHGEFRICIFRVIDAYLLSPVGPAENYTRLVTIEENMYSHVPFDIRDFKRYIMMYQTWTYFFRPPLTDFHDDLLSSRTSGG